ncbi:AAA family ATPase [Tumebacillus flagellatus]|uniref:AAA+ ATPase domain-containing protein n=1 Tax=Tumebacillus flagellatus TaxID=1157490 RepID=A0A074LRZ4_9BACL|nr:AAA family ATPase [Tumebacillus flagellatus]KEO83250.1 hypothetical protein EL26_11205 [Tumebacillus flagellatus]
MNQILEVKIESFRGIRDLHLEGLGAVNLIVGGNNTGKTSVLEALELLCNPLSVEQFIETSMGRDRMLDSPVDVDSSVEWLFPLLIKSNQEGEGPIDRDFIRLTAVIQGEEHSYTASCLGPFRLGWSRNGNFEKSLKVNIEHLRSDQLYKCVFLTKMLMEEEYSKPILDTKMVTPVDHRMLPIASKSLTESFQSDKAGLVQLLQIFDKDIIGVEILSPDGESAIPHVQHRTKSYIPVSVYGDGMRRVLTLASAVIRAKRGVLLIDEMETALHPRMLAKVFSWLVDACAQYDVQVFATTHSLEAIDAVLETYVDIDLDTEDVSLDRLGGVVGYRLVQQENNTTAKRFAGRDLYSLRHEYGQDVR